MRNLNVNRKYNLQARLNQLRKESDMTEKQLKDETMSLFGMFKVNGKYKDKYVGLVPLRLIQCDNSYQVPQLVNPAIVEHIAHNYDSRIMEPVKLAIRNYEGGEPGFWIPDGRHRVLAALERGEEYIFADVFEVKSKYDEIGIFRDQYKNKNRLKAYGKYNAMLLQGNEVAKIVQQSCAEHNLMILPIRKPNLVNQVCCIDSLMRLASLVGKEGLDFVFDVIYDAYMDSDKAAYSKDVISTVAYAYRHFGSGYKAEITSVLKGRSVEAFKADAKSKFKEKKTTDALKTYMAFCVSKVENKVVSIPA